MMMMRWFDMIHMIDIFIICNDSWFMIHDYINVENYLMYDYEIMILYDCMMIDMINYMMTMICQTNKIQTWFGSTWQMINPSSCHMLRTQVPISPEDQGAQSSAEAHEEGQTREVGLKASGQAGSGGLRGFPTGTVWHSTDDCRNGPNVNMTLHPSVSPTAPLMEWERWFWMMTMTMILMRQGKTRWFWFWFYKKIPSSHPVTLSYRIFPTSLLHSIRSGL